MDQISILDFSVTLLPPFQAWLGRLQDKINPRIKA
jgi:hypothetical protein